MGMKTIVVLGGGGMLADSFKEVLDKDKDFKTFLLDKDKVNITHYGQIENSIRIFNPDVIINCAAYTNTNWAEVHFEKAYRINVLGAINCAKACKKHNIKLVHIDSCFSLNPVNEYGMSKNIARYAVMQILGKGVYVPTLGWLFGSRNDNQFMKLVLDSIKKDRSLDLTSDSYGSPTYTLDAVEYIINKVKKDASGEEDVANKGRVTRWEYCEEIFKILGKKNIFKLNNDFFEMAKRPKDVSLKGQLRPYEEALKEFLTERLPNLSYSLSK